MFSIKIPIYQHISGQSTWRHAERLWGDLEPYLLHRGVIVEMIGPKRIMASILIPSPAKTVAAYGSMSDLRRGKIHFRLFRKALGQCIKSSTTTHFSALAQWPNTTTSAAESFTGNTKGKGS